MLVEISTLALLSPRPAIRRGRGKKTLISLYNSKADFHIRNDLSSYIEISGTKPYYIGDAALIIINNYVNYGILKYRKLFGKPT